MVVLLLIAVIGTYTQQPPSTQPSETIASFIRESTLKPGEAVRRVEGPFTDVRNAAAHELIEDDSVDPQLLTLVVERSEKPAARLYSMGTPSLGNILMHVLSVPPNEFTLTAKLANTKIDGDWIIDPRAPPDTRMRDLATVVSKHINRPVSFQRAKEEVDCIVLTGSFKPPITEADRVRRIELPVDDVEFLHWINIDQCPTSEFAQRLSYATGWPVFDETKRGDSIGLIDYGSAKHREHVGGGEMQRTDPEHIKTLITAIARQTGFEIHIQRRTIERWHLRE